MHPPTFSKEEVEQLNQLIGHALVDPVVWQHLESRDAALIDQFKLTQHVWQVVSTIDAVSLTDFCQQLLEIESERPRRH